MKKMTLYLIVKSFCLTLTLLMMVSLNAQDFAGGSGTEGSPWQITTATHLNNIRNYLGDSHADKYFILMNDIINLKDTYTNWDPIGNSDNRFKGKFDGNNNKITGLKIDRATTDNVGLFGYLDAGGKIENLGVEIDAATYVKGKNYVGGVLGQNSSGLISNCYSTGTVIGNICVGGLVGADMGGTIEYSHSSVNVTGNSTSDNAVGGLVGSTHGSISHSYATGNVTGAGAKIGGLVGALFTSAIVSDSYATGTVSGDSKTGGLVGVIDNANASVTNSYATGNASVSSSKSWCGGLAGGNYGTISNCYAEGSASGSTAIGGLVGYNSNNVSNSYAIGAVSGRESLGGFVGNNTNGTIQNCYSRGNVTCTNYSYPYFGGFVGHNSQGKILNSYSTGWVKINTSLQINKGFCGLATTGGNYEMSGNFWDTETSESSSTAGDAVGKTTSEMKTLSTFADAGWDFEMETTNGTDDIWDMDYSQTINNGYPYLSWQDGEDVSLPVTLSSFKAKAVKGTVILEWETSAEIENQGFVLSRKSKVESQKSEIIADFSTDDALKGQGTTTETTKYAFTDKSVEPGKTYVYTLADVDYAGVETVLEKVEVKVEAEGAVVADGYALSPVYPNPFNATLTVPFTLTEPMAVSIELYSLTGQRMMTVVNREFVSGSYNYTVQVDDLASGIYFVRTSFGKKTHMQKAVLLK